MFLIGEEGVCGDTDCDFAWDTWWDWGGEEDGECEEELVANV